MLQVVLQKSSMHILQMNGLRRNEGQFMATSRY